MAFPAPVTLAPPLPKFQTWRLLLAEVSSVDRVPVKSLREPVRILVIRTFVDMPHAPEPERLPEKVYVAPEEPFCTVPWVAPISKLAAVVPAEKWKPLPSMKMVPPPSVFPAPKAAQLALVLIFSPFPSSSRRPVKLVLPVLEMLTCPAASAVPMVMVPAPLSWACRLTVPPERAREAPSLTRTMVALLGFTPMVAPPVKASVPSSTVRWARVFPEYPSASVPSPVLVSVVPTPMTSAVSPAQETVSPAPITETFREPPSPTLTRLETSYPVTSLPAAESA
ncbi:unknown [Akkermansia sp. CAG:344]|nr:unknown [Akkermansia sp. CAG:344]